MSAQPTENHNTWKKPPTLVLLGNSGVGKSTLANVFSGLTPNADHFAVNHNFIPQPQLSETIDIKVVDFCGDSSRKIKIVDTIGFDSGVKEDTLGVVCDILNDIASQCNFVNIFAFVINAQDPYFTRSVLCSIRMIETFYGTNFWKHVVFIFTRTSMDHKNKVRRVQNRGTRDDDWATQLLISLAEIFPDAKETNHYFIDAFCDRQADAEVRIMNEETKKFWKVLENTGRKSTKHPCDRNTPYSSLDTSGR